MLRLGPKVFDPWAHSHTSIRLLPDTLTRLMAFAARINLAKRFFPHTHTHLTLPSYADTLTQAATLAFPVMATNVTRFI